MQYDEFAASLAGHQAPSGLNDYALALWHDAKDNWEKAHNIIQDIDNATAAWVHAYLHRKEGDAGNAAYWYRLAGKNMPSYTLQREWEEIARAVI